MAREHLDTRKERRKKKQSHKNEGTVKKARRSSDTNYESAQYDKERWKKLQRIRK